MYLGCLILLSALESETVWKVYTDVVESKVKTSFLLSESCLLVCKCSLSLQWSFQKAMEVKLIVLFLQNDCYFSTSSCAVCWHGNMMLKLWELIRRGQCFQQDLCLSCLQLICCLQLNPVWKQHKLGQCSGTMRRKSLSILIMNTAGCKERAGASKGNSNLNCGKLPDFLS